MFNFLMYFLMTVMLEGHAGGNVIVVPVRSHEILSNAISHNKVELLYDDSIATSGAFYSSNQTFAKVLFDLGKNYVIDHFIFTMKRMEKRHNISILVGNLVNGQGGLIYACESSNKLSEDYKCQPECRTSTLLRPGIISRNFIMNLKVSYKWISVYDMKVYALSVLFSEDISSNRLVLPSGCLSRSWLLTDKSINANVYTATSSRTNVYFEKTYIITEIDLEFEKNPPQTLDLVMISASNQNNSFVINLSDCMFQRSLFTCKINATKFPLRQVQFVTPGLIKAFIRGKSVYFPKLGIKTSTNFNENLKMTCEYNPCDLSVHSDCSDDTINAGVKFGCVNRRLIRMPSGSDQDSYVIVNHGKLEPVWTSTRFTIVSNNIDAMSISIPRSYQYFGQYKCACIVSDMMNLVIFSEVTQLKEADFLEDLFFDTLIQYKVSESEDAILQNVSNNIIYLSKSTLGITFVPVKVSMLSLVPGNVVTIKYLADGATETISIDSSSKHNVKAFDSIQESWSVETHNYVVDEIFSDFNHDTGISICTINSLYKLKHNSFIRMLDEDKVKIKPSVWSANDNRKTQLNIMYASTDEAKLYYLEKSCSGSNKSVLSRFTKDQCTSVDARLVCAIFKDAYLLTFKDATNFAKDVVFDLRSIKTNTSIEKVLIQKDIILKQEDVTLKPRYISLGFSIKSKNVSVVRVEVEVMSKKIEDFIICGSVMIKINIPNKDQENLILQSSSFNIDVDMEEKEVIITMEVTIEKAKGSHVSQHKITDPTTLSVKGFKFQEDKILNLIWTGIDDIALALLDSYEIKIETTVLACNSTKAVVKTIPKSQTFGAKNRYQLALDAVSKNHMIIMIVTLQPIFLGNKRAQNKLLVKHFNNISQSLVSIEDLELTTERSLTITPSQSDIPCNIKEVQFNVKGINVKQFQWKSVSLDNMKYKITNLIPGRDYELTAKVIYAFEPHDIISQSYNFETADDISILKTKHVAQLNEKVNISCTVDVGPDDIFRKTVEWLRADKSILPDGVRSHTSGYNPNMAYIIMDQTLADYTGEYGCFAKPSASIGSMKISIIVNDLVVFPTELQVDFSKKEKILVTCSSSAVAESKVAWVDPLGTIIPEGDSKKYSMIRIITEQNVDKATLIINSASLDISGTYTCHKSVGNIKVNQEFILYGYEKLRIESLPINSSYVGEKLQLRCIADYGKKGQHVTWEIPTTKNSLISLIKHSSIENFQDIEIVNCLTIQQVTCKLLPPLKEDSEALSASHQIKLQSKIVIKGPGTVDAGTNVHLLCLGYPDLRNLVLEWIFYSKNTTTIGKVIKSSATLTTQKSHEHIKLEYNLTDVKENETGRYECKFKSTNSAVGSQYGKSINLMVNAVSKPALVVHINNNTKKSALSSVSNSMGMTLVITLSVFIKLTRLPRL